MLLCTNIYALDSGAELEFYDWSQNNNKYKIEPI